MRDQTKPSCGYARQSCAAMTAGSARPQSTCQAHSGPLCLAHLCCAVHALGYMCPNAPMLLHRTRSCWWYPVQSTPATPAVQFKRNPFQALPLCAPVPVIPVRARSQMRCTPRQLGSMCPCFRVPCACAQFNEMKSENDGRSPLITPEQHHWLSVQQMLSSTTIQVRAHAHVCVSVLGVRRLLATALHFVGGFQWW